MHDAAPADASESSLVVCTAAVAHYNRGLLAWQQHQILATQMGTQELQEALTHVTKVCECLRLCNVCAYVLVPMDNEMSIGISSAAYFTLFCTQAHKLCRKALSLKKGGSPSEQTQSDLQVFQGQISLLRGRLHRAIVPRADMDTHKLTVYSACAMRDLVFFDGTANFSMTNGIRSCTVFMIFLPQSRAISIARHPLTWSPTRRM